jgi:hypothetical protein
VSQHFLLSSAARSLTLGSVARMSDEEAERVFMRLRWQNAEGWPARAGGRLDSPPGGTSSMGRTGWGTTSMIRDCGPLMAEDGAYLLVEFDQRDRQVIVRTKVCLDMPDRSVSETPQSQICATMTVAHEFALDIARSRSLPVVWGGAEYVANVGYGSWSIRLGAFELESGGTIYPTQDTARMMLRAHAQERGFGDRVRWEDGHA